MSRMSESKSVRSMIERLVRSVVREETRDCVRAYKAVVVSAPSSGVCSVQLIGDTSVLSLPYSSKCSGVSVGEVVWVAVLFGSMRNAIVWETADFQ